MSPCAGFVEKEDCIDMEKIGVTSAWGKGRENAEQMSLGVLGQ